MFKHDRGSRSILISGANDHYWLLYATAPSEVAYNGSASLLVTVQSVSDPSEFKGSGFQRAAIGTQNSVICAELAAGAFEPSSTTNQSCLRQFPSQGDTELFWGWSIFPKPGFINRQTLVISIQFENPEATHVDTTSSLKPTYYLTQDVIVTEGWTHRFPPVITALAGAVSALATAATLAAGCLFAVIAGKTKDSPPHEV